MAGLPRQAGLAGEVFSEEWRTLVGERLGGGEPCFDSASLYGTADAGVLAAETPLSICIRRYLAAHPTAARELFGEPRFPTLAQYDPRSRLFEMDDGTVSYFGANIYPENITVGLEQPLVAAWVTGKFVMESREASDHDRYLAIAVELAPGVAGTEEIRWIRPNVIRFHCVTGMWRSAVRHDRRQR